jgi:hypothetical protein
MQAFIDETLRRNRERFGDTVAIAIGAEKDSLANKYATDAPNGGLCSADPGTAGAATNELTGGSPAYARKSMGWSTSSGGAGQVSGSPTFDVASGSTVAYMIVCASATAGTADVKDRTAVTSQAFSSQGTYQPSTTYTQG